MESEHRTRKFKCQDCGQKIPYTLIGNSGFLWVAVNRNKGTLTERCPEGHWGAPNN